jgi:hypothetical protein
MNYTYKIFNDHVQEFPESVDVEEHMRSWKIELLNRQFDSLYGIVSEASFKSYKRTVEWILKNHPELMV